MCNFSGRQNRNKVRKKTSEKKLEFIRTKNAERVNTFFCPISPRLPKKPRAGCPHATSGTRQGMRDTLVVPRTTGAQCTTRTRPACCEQVFASYFFPIISVCPHFAQGSGGSLTRSNGRSKLFTIWEVSARCAGEGRAGARSAFWSCVRVRMSTHDFSP